MQEQEPVDRDTFREAWWNTVAGHAPHQMLLTCALCAVRVTLVDLQQVSEALSLGPHGTVEQMVEGAVALQQRIADEIAAHHRTRTELSQYAETIEDNQRHLRTALLDTASWTLRDGSPCWCPGPVGGHQTDNDTCRQRRSVLGFLGIPS